MLKQSKSPSEEFRPPRKWVGSSWTLCAHHLSHVSLYRRLYWFRFQHSCFQVKDPTLLTVQENGKVYVGNTRSEYIPQTIHLFTYRRGVSRERTAWLNVQTPTCICTAVKQGSVKAGSYFSTAQYSYESRTLSNSKHCLMYGLEKEGMTVYGSIALKRVKNLEMYTVQP